MRTVRFVAALILACALCAVAPTWADSQHAWAATGSGKTAVTKATSSSKGKLSVKVKKVAKAKSYQVAVSTSSRFTKKTTKTKTAKKTAVTFTKLKAGKTYYVRARAKVSGKKSWGPWSAKKKVRVSNGIGATSVTKLAQPSSTKLTVTVKKAKGANRYQVALCTSKKFPSSSTKYLTSKSATVKATGLKAGQTYYVKARAYKLSGKTKTYGAWSAVKSVKMGSKGTASSDSSYESFANLSSTQLIKKVKGYTYKVKPVNGKLNNIVFVETDNPDPNSFRLVDKSSKYLPKGEEAVFRPCPYTFRDVVYSNETSRRIANKGYLFYCYETASDGGTLEVRAQKNLQNETSYQPILYWNGQQICGDGYKGQKYDTGKTASCPALEDKVDYMIRTYAANKSSFFDKMNAVNQGLSGLAVYTKELRDVSKPTGRYPCLAVSPYGEMNLQKHVESMYQVDKQRLFLDDAYGFCLNSLGYPGFMKSVAMRLEPSCTVEQGNMHSYVNVTFEGKTASYGGAGTGTPNDLYSNYIKKTFKFDGTDIGFGTNPSLTTMRNQRLEYAKKCDAIADGYLAKLSDESISKVIGAGAWLAVAREEGSGIDVGRVYAVGFGNGEVTYARDAWVDGRYVGQRFAYEKGATFSSHPQASIVRHNVTYKDYADKTHTGDVIYIYDTRCGTDSWIGLYNFYQKYDTWYDNSTINRMDSSLKLSRAQVNAMKLDGSTNAAPKAQYVYDGSAAPGSKAK